MAINDDEGESRGLDGVTERFRAPPRQKHGLTVRIIRDGVAEQHPLPKAGKVVIGRAKGADIRIEDASISRQHAALHVGPTLTIEDLGSANGTRVAGRLIVAGEPVPVAAL